MPKPRRRSADSSALTLTEFVRAQRQKDCPVCALPQDVRQQLQQAPKQKIKVEDRVAWLRTAHGADITVHDLARHMNARHDYA